MRYPLRLGLLAALLCSLSARAANELAGEKVLVVHICQTATCSYLNDARKAATALSQEGAVVTEVTLGAIGAIYTANSVAAPFASLLSAADQVWVLDFSSSNDDTAAQTATPVRSVTPVKAGRVQDKPWIARPPTLVICRARATRARDNART